VDDGFAPHCARAAQVLIMMNEDKYREKSRTGRRKKRKRLQNSRKNQEMTKRRLQEVSKGREKQQQAKKNRKKSAQTDLHEPESKNSREFSAGKIREYRLAVRILRELVC
jgi:hypothetical protein